MLWGCASGALLRGPMSGRRTDLFCRIQESALLEHNVSLVAVLFPALLLTPGPAEFTSVTSDDRSITVYADCLLERIGSQLVRCDNLTGGGVDAPFWIPEQK